MLFADALVAALTLIGAASFYFFWSTWTTGDASQLRTMFTHVIPAFAFSALFVTLLIAARTVASQTAEQCFPTRPAFGRKGNLICGASILFIFSCCYRSIFVADEGASMCRGAPTVFNAPVSGRAIATAGEVALVVQISNFLDDSARRLGVSSDLWAHRWRFTLLPVCLAEAFSWCGVLTGISRFYCAEYVMWMVIAFTWAWDSAELLHKSSWWSDRASHACVCCGGLALFAFNAGVEIPHFFLYHVSETHDEATIARLSILTCHQDAESPLWLARLPFFYTYFSVASWGSCALSYRYLRRGRSRDDKAERAS